MGSSSSGSNSAPLGLLEGGRARKRLTENIWTICKEGRQHCTGTENDTNLRVDGFGEDSSVLGDELHHFLERGSLHLLPLEVGQGVGDKVEEDRALADLLNEQFLFLGEVGFIELWQLDQFSVLSDIEPGAALSPVLLDVGSAGELDLADCCRRRGLRRLAIIPTLGLFPVRLLGWHLY